MVRVAYKGQWVKTMKTNLPPWIQSMTGNFWPSSNPAGFMTLIPKQFSFIPYTVSAARVLSGHAFPYCFAERTPVQVSEGLWDKETILSTSVLSVWHAKKQVLVESWKIKAGICAI